MLRRMSARGGTRTRNALAGAQLLRPLTLPVCPPGPDGDPAASYAGAQELRGGCREPGGGVLSFDRIPFLIKPRARPAPRRSLARRRLHLRAPARRGVGG